MKIAFYCDSPDVFKTEQLMLLMKDNHKLVRMRDDIVITSWDAIIMDGEGSKKSIINRAHNCKMKTVLLDGTEEDAQRVNLSISGFKNPNATYTGPKYAIFPKNKPWVKHDVDNKHRAVFVSADRYLDEIVSILGALGFNSIVHGATHPAAVTYDEQDCYNALRECFAAIVTRHTPMLQCLYYGIPTITLNQNILHSVKDTYINGNIKTLKDTISNLYNDEYKRLYLNNASKMFFDGLGLKRTHELIQNLV